tara:strand:+ start:714 stop:1184 length:471 start_codon:yes stop_codon:yes gene_type:complete
MQTQTEPPKPNHVELIADVEAVEPPGEVEMESSTKQFLQHFPDWARLLFGILGGVAFMTAFYYSTRADLGHLKSGLTEIKQKLGEVSARYQVALTEVSKRVAALEQQNKLNQLLIGGIERLRERHTALSAKLHALQVDVIRLKTLQERESKKRGPP